MRSWMAGLMLALAACSPGTSGPKITPAEGTTAVNEPEQAGVAVAETTLPASEMTLNAPAEGAQVESPMEVTGVAPNNWFFEAVFPLRLVDKDGKVLAEAPAQAQSEWTKEGPVNFKGALEFTVTQETPAVLVLEEDMPGEGKDPRTLKRSIVLVPKK